MANGSYRIKVVHENEQFEVEGDKRFVIEMMEKYRKGNLLESNKPEKIMKSKVDDSSKLMPSAQKAISIGEFIRQTGYKKHTDLVLALGYFLEKQEGIKAFTPADINKCYYEAKMESSNTSQMIIQNIKRGFFMEARGSKKGGQKQYTVTQTGIDQVEKKIILNTK